MFKLIKNIATILFLLIVTAAVWVYFAGISGSYNVLLIGADEVEKYSRHSDTIILASCNMKEKKITLLSIPRDTLVYYNGR